MSNEQTDGTMLTLADCAKRWGVTVEQASEIADLLPTMCGYDHRLADGTGLYPWPTVDGQEKTFPELLSGDVLHVREILSTLRSAAEAFGLDSMSISELVYQAMNLRDCQHRLDASVAA
jgi:hypothetical protein